MAPVFVQNRPFKIGAVHFYLLCFALLSPAHQGARREVRPSFFLNGPEGESMHLAFRSLVILIVLHLINNYYERGSHSPLFT